MPDLTPVSPRPAGTFFERHWKWFVLGTLFYATFLNYLDRQTLSVALDPIAKEFNLDIAARGRLLAAFVFAYAFSHLFIGFAIDWVKNLRWFFALMLLGWSLVTLRMGFARDYHDLFILRCLLGVFECINFPICLLIISRIFPREQRALASGIFASGAVFATLIAPKLVIYLSSELHWRWAFFISGGLGLTWLVPWLLIFRHPEKRSAGWSAALAEQQAPDTAGQRTLASVLRRPAFWAVASVGVGLIPGVYFVSQWLPSYFTHEWKVSYNQALGDRLVLIYFAQDIGLWLGGWFVLRLVALGREVLDARRLVIFCSFALAMSIMGLPFITSLNVATSLICIYVFALGCWNANNSAFKQEVNSGRVATVAALVGFIETGFSAFVVQKVGEVAQSKGGFSAVFPLLAGFLLFSVLLVFFFYRPRYFPGPATKARSAGS
jgi:ACS family hexuronate transporter-like MFS transporter